MGVCVSLRVEVRERTAYFWNVYMRKRESACVCVCVLCVCVCVRERDGETETEIDKESETVCVCVCGFVVEGRAGDANFVQCPSVCV